MKFRNLGKFITDNCNNSIMLNDLRQGYDYEKWRQCYRIFLFKNTLVECGNIYNQADTEHVFVQYFYGCALHSIEKVYKNKKIVRVEYMYDNPIDPSQYAVKHINYKQNAVSSVHYRNTKDYISYSKQYEYTATGYTVEINRVITTIRTVVTPKIYSQF